MSDKKKPVRREPRPKAVELREDQLGTVAGGGRSGTRVQIGDVTLTKG